MGNLIQSTTEFAMHIVRAYVQPGDIVIDATCGNGHDTLKLAGMQPSRIYAFDIQQEAIESARRLLISEGWRPDEGWHPDEGWRPVPVPEADHARVNTPSPAFALDSPGSGGTKVILTRAGHECMPEFFRSQELPREDGALSDDGFASAIVFNLGYLPGGDKTLTTRTDTSLSAVRGCLQLLKTGGLICITMYSGHPEGANEKRALLAWAEELDSRQWHVSYVSMPNQKHDPPEILLITRK